MAEQQKYSDMVNQRRNEMVDVVLSYMEQNPTEWQSGWQKFGCPINAVSGKQYRGINLLYLAVVSMARKYTDNRWVTYVQAKELGAHVKSGETAVPVLYYSIYDTNTKKDFDAKTVAGMTDEERIEYEKKYVRAYTKFYQVFNAEQCRNFPERAVNVMDEKERQRQNELVERIIANSAAPVLYDGGDSAYYSISTDDIHLPLIEHFNTMQDYYATALHEIAHSTGHASRLNRDMSGDFGGEKYAIEELRAELSSMFLQMENGLILDGHHYQNHGAYLSSWLKAAKDNKTVFTSAVKDAMKISDYINDHYNVAAATRSQDNTKEKAELATRFAILDAAMKVAREDMNYVDALYTDTYLDAHFSEHNSLEKQVKSNGVAPATDPILVQSLIEEFTKSLVVPQYGWEQSDVERALVEKINDAALKEQATRLVYHSETLFDNTPISETNPLLTVEAKQIGYYTGTTSVLQGNDGFAILHDQQRDKWYLWSSDWIQGKTIDLQGAREQLTIGQSAKKSEILRTFDNEKELVAFDSKEQAREYWDRESAKIVALREQYHEINSVTEQRQAELDSLMSEKSTLFRENTKEKKSDQSQVAAETVAQVDTRLPISEKTYREFTVGEFNDMPEHLQQYYLRKDKQPNAVVFVRMGDFYQAFGPDAQILSDKLDLPPTSQSVKGFEQSVPAVGVPYYSFKQYVDSLNKLGVDVVSCEKQDEHYHAVMFAAQQEQTLNDEQEQTSESTANNTPDANQERIVKDVQKGKIKNWQQVDKTVSGYAETSYEYFEDVNSVAMYKHNNTDTYYIGPLEYHAKNKAVKAENFIFDKETALKEFAAVKAFKERELRARDEDLKKLSREELESRIANELHNKYVGDSIQMSYAKMLLARKEQEQKSELAAEHKAQEQQAQRTVENVEQQQPSEKQTSETKTQEISHTSWTKIALEEQQIGARYDKSTMIKLPDTAQLKGYVVFVPSKVVRKDKQGCSISLKGDMHFTIKNDGMEMKVTASELASLLQGKDIGKEPLRVAPKKINKDRIEALDKNLPSELKELNQWCAFTTYREDDGHYKKKNIDVHSGKNKDWAKPNDPTTWTDFKTAKQYALDNNCAGLTIVLTPESGVTCIDLDKCIDDAGNVSEFAQKVLKATEGTYAEKSVSGHGIHIFVKGDLLDNGKYKNVSGSKETKNEIEVYNQSKFISLTGDAIGDSALKLNNIKPAQLTALHELMEKRPTVNTKKNFSTVRTATADVVEQRILRSRKKNEYQRLMAGDSLSGGDHSKDDFKLLNILAFFSDCDANVMRELFMRSRLYREEGGVGSKKSNGYLDTSIKNAINSLANRPRGFADKEQQPGLFDRRNKGTNLANNCDGGGTGGNSAGADK